MLGMLIIVVVTVKQPRQVDSLQKQVLREFIVHVPLALKQNIKSENI
jgi:hypothetical protein